MVEEYPLKIYAEPKLQNSSLVVGWSDDAGKLGAKVTDYLIRSLKCQEFGEIQPADFFPLDGVAVEDDVAQFPESRFYWCQEGNLVVFKSTPPRSRWYRFLSCILDVAQDYCHTTELYTIGGMVYFGAHTTPRELSATASSLEMKGILSRYDLARDINYETPPGQRPTLNSFLLWVAKRRNIAAANLWVPIPFYLVAAEDPEASKKTMEFLDRRLNLGLDFSDLDEEVARQNERIAQLRVIIPEIDAYIGRLESNLSITQEESEKLVREVQEFLRKKD